MNRIRINILLLLLLQLAFKTGAQILPSTCTESRVRYASTPDTLLQNSHFKWFIIGDYTDTTFYGRGDSIDIHWGSSPGSYKIGISEVSEQGCIGDTVWSTIEVQGASIDLGPDQNKCVGESYQFTANNSFQSYFWNDTLLTSDSYFKGTAQKTDTITVEGIINNCRSRDTAILFVHPLPNITFTEDGTPVKDSIIVCENQKVTLGAGNDGLNYNWSTNEHTPYIITGLSPSRDTQNISVDVISEYGCESKDSIEIIPCKQFIPNAFTPDRQKNHTWEIPFLIYYPEATVDVYDRWGNLVFHSRGYTTPGWDGKCNGITLPTENYIYIIQLNSNSKPIVGSVTIIRAK